MKSTETHTVRKKQAQLQSYLEKFSPENINSLEMLDGFFTALHCLPDRVPPSEFLHEIWGDFVFEGMEETQNFLNLMMPYFNTVLENLTVRDIFYPLLMKNNKGEILGNDWALGFLKGIRLRPHWMNELLADEDLSFAVFILTMLAHENSSNPKLRITEKPITAEDREALLEGLAIGAMKIYDYFEPHRRQFAMAQSQKDTIRNAHLKTGRNELCPCGSGKKYKHCCIHGTRH